MPTTEHNGVITYTPDNRGYQPPPPAAPEWRAPEPWAPAVKVEGTPLQQDHAAITHANNEFKRHIAATEEVRANFSPEGYQAQVDAFQTTPAAKAVDRALESVTARRDAAAANVDKVRRDLSPAGDTATELRNTRYWDRTVKILDSVDNDSRLSSVTDELIANADRAQLGVLLDELEPYLQARVQKLNSPRDRAQLIDSYRSAIEAATARVVPEYAQARAVAKQAESAFQVMRTNVQHVRNGFANGRPAAVLIDPSKFDPDA